MGVRGQRKEERREEGREGERKDIPSSSTGV